MNLPIKVILFRRKKNQKWLLMDFTLYSDSPLLKRTIWAQPPLSCLCYSRAECFAWNLRRNSSHIHVANDCTVVVGFEFARSFEHGLPPEPWNFYEFMMQPNCFKSPLLCTCKCLWPFKCIFSSQNLTSCITFWWVNSPNLISAKGAFLQNCESLKHQTFPDVQYPVCKPRLC